MSSPSTLGCGHAEMLLVPYSTCSIWGSRECVALEGFSENASPLGQMIHNFRSVVKQILLSFCQPTLFLDKEKPKQEEKV